MGKASHSCSSSIDSSSHPCLSSASSLPSQPNKDLSTDLRLGLSISTSHHYSSNSRDQQFDWPPIKPLLRSTLAEKGIYRQQPTFFVKVYMEGIPIGRKLDLFAHQGYDSLTRTLTHMFKTNIHFPADLDGLHSDGDHLLTYEDKEGDWMMMGDVPWEMFLTTVKRLKITRANKC